MSVKTIIEPYTKYLPNEIFIFSSEFSVIELKEYTTKILVNKNVNLINASVVF